MEKEISRHRLVTGWLAVSGSILITSYWAFWGITENFHEGWYHHHLGKNLAMLFGQYLSWMLSFMVVALLALRWPRVGAAIHVIGAIAILTFVWGSHPTTLATIYVPFFLLAAGYWFGRAQPRRLAVALLVGIPLLVTIGFAVEPAIRLSGRVDDMNREARRVTANGVDLIWAPEGPGWPLQAGNVTWEEARDICRHLGPDGKTVMETPQDIWRLPTVEEFVRSQHRKGKPCDGTWDEERKKPSYQRPPDKESPLWATDSRIIYWWIGTEVDEKHGYKVSYRGTVRGATKDSSFTYWGYRAVREPPAGAK